MLAHLRRLAYVVLLLLREPHPDRNAVLRTYLRLKLRQIVAAPKGPGTVRFLGWRLRYFDYATFVFVFEEIFAERIYETEPAPTGATILDCGANIGMATLYFRRRHPGATIHAFEPAQRTFDALEENVRRAGAEGVELHRAAVGAQDGEIVLFHDPGGEGSVGASTIAGTRVVTGQERVPAVRVSTFCDRPVALLKLDVEGAELQVLEELAAAGRLGDVERIVADFNHHDDLGDETLGRMLRLLDEHGFGYELHAPFPLPFRDREPQDVIVYAYNRGRNT